MNLEQDGYDVAYPWLSKAEWKKQQTRGVSGSVAIAEGVLHDLVPRQFREQGAALYVEGLAAVPRQLTGVSSQVVDLRMVFPRQFTPKNSRDYEDLHGRIKDTYNSSRAFANARAVMGNISFEMSSDGLVYDRLTPVSGKAINLHLPLEWRYGIEASIEDFEQFHRENLQMLGEDIDALRRNVGESSPDFELRRLELLAEAYIVRLTA